MEGTRVRSNTSNIVLTATRDQLKKQIPDFRPGDTLRVAVRIIEGDKERIQNFEGVCIGRSGQGMDAMFTVRRVSFGIGMERNFPLNSPRIESITVLRHGRVRRAKLYYLRDLTGKKARLSETRRKRLDKGHMLEIAGEGEIAPEASGSSEATSGQTQAEDASESADSTAEEPAASESKS